MELSETALQSLYALGAAMMGAVVGGVFTLKATDKAIRDGNAKETKREEREIQNVLDAIGVEMNALWSFHMRRIGERVEQLPDHSALEFYYPLTQDYFTIYHSNATMIGRIYDPVLREAIVVCYNKCKKVVDGFKYNNTLFREYRDLVMMAPNAPRHEDHVNAKYHELIHYAQLIKEDHWELKSYVERLMKLLSERH